MCTFNEQYKNLKLDLFMFKLFPGAIIKLCYLMSVAIVFVNSLLIVVVWPF